MSRRGLDTARAGEPRLEDAADRHSDVGGESGSARIIRMEDV